MIDFYEVPLEALKKEENSLINEIEEYKEMLNDIAEKTDENYAAYGHKELRYLKPWKLDEDDFITPKGTWQAINSEEKGWSFVCKDEDDNVIGTIELDLEGKKLWFGKWDGADSEAYPHNMLEEDFSLKEFINDEVEWFAEYELSELDRFQRLIIYESFGIDEKEIDKIFEKRGEWRAKNEYMFFKEQVSKLKDLKKEMLKAIDRHKYDSEQSYTNYLKTQGLKVISPKRLHYPKAYRFDGIEIGRIDVSPNGADRIFPWVVAWTNKGKDEKGLYPSKGYRTYKEMMEDLKLPEGSPLRKIVEAIDYHWDMSKIAYNDFKLEKKLKNSLGR